MRFLIYLIRSDFITSQLHVKYQMKNMNKMCHIQSHQAVSRRQLASWVGDEEFSIVLKAKNIFHYLFSFISHGFQFSRPKSLPFRDLRATKSHHWTGKQWRGRIKFSKIELFFKLLVVWIWFALNYMNREEITLQKLKLTSSELNLMSFDDRWYFKLKQILRTLQ